MLDQRKVLAEELQHRVRNNLQLVYAMLSKQLKDTPDEAGQRGLKAIARREGSGRSCWRNLVRIAEFSSERMFGDALP